MVHAAEATGRRCDLRYYQELSGNVCEHKFAYDLVYMRESMPGRLGSI